MKLAASAEKRRQAEAYQFLQPAANRFLSEHMKAAGFTDFERGIEGSTAEHLDVLEYKVKQDRQAVQELQAGNRRPGYTGRKRPENSGMNCAARLQPQQATYGLYRPT